MAQVNIASMIASEPLFFYLEDFTLLPYFRMTQRTKYFKNAQRYLSNHTVLKKRLTSILEEQERQCLLSGYYFPDEMPFQLVMLISDNTLNIHKCDLDNLVKSVLDGAQGLIYKDDRFCDSVFVQRHNSSKKNLLSLCFAPLNANPINLYETLKTHNTSHEKYTHTNTH